MSDSKVDPRIEIQTFQENEERFSLFTQALMNLLCTGCQQDRLPPCVCSLSHVEAGIAKEAHVIIDKVDPKEWSSVETQKLWTEAADGIRIPFWDRSASTPRVLSEPKLTLAMPNGSSKEVDNILLRLRDRLPSQ